MQIGVNVDKAIDNKRVFVLDTDEIISAALQFMLHDENETHELADLAAVYRKAVDWKPDVLLLGMSIVQERGVEVLTEIHDRIADLKIILVVDTANDPLAQDGLKHGAHSLLVKPLTIEKVRQKVDMQLGRKTALAIPVSVTGG